MNQKLPVHLIQYRHDGATWTIEIQAKSEQDAIERIHQLQKGQYLGVLQMKLPVELGLVARFICWWQNRRRISENFG